MALAVFALVSVLGGLVSSPGLLIAARFVKGVAAAFTAPASMSLLTTTFSEGPMRNRAFSVYTVFGASGFSLGRCYPACSPRSAGGGHCSCPLRSRSSCWAPPSGRFPAASARSGPDASSTCPVR